MRMIDADAVKNIIRSGVSTDTEADQEYVCERIDEAPSVEIIRCGECKWFDNGKNDSEIWSMCTRHFGKYIDVNADDFCSYGERNCSEKPNNCEVECEKCKHFREEADTYMKQCEYYFMECRFEPKDEPTISKMEQVEITADDFNEDDESCENCRWFNPMKSLGCNLDDDECYYSPKDEPQTGKE